MGLTRLLRQDPGPNLPGRIVSDVLGVPARKFGDPLRLRVQMVADNPAIHGGVGLGVQTTGIEHTRQEPGTLDRLGPMGLASG